MKDLNQVFNLKDNLLISEKFGNNVQVIFTTKLGGVSTGVYTSNNLAFQVGDKPEAVLENRKKLAKQINSSLKRFVFANQNHGINIKKITEQECGKGMLDFADGITATDCLYTYEKDLPLACFYADCTPIYFYEPQKNLIGVIHAGWQGTSKNIVEEVLNHLQQVEKVDLQALKVIIGPNIKKESFEVQEDVYKLFKDNSYTTQEVISKNQDTWNIDIVKYNENALLQNGVKKANIFISTLDTVQEQDLFSFRRDKETGRMLGVIKLC